MALLLERLFDNSLYCFGRTEGPKDEGFQECELCERAVSRRLWPDNEGLGSLLVPLRSSCQNCLHHVEDFCHSISKATDLCVSAQLLRGLAENVLSCPEVSVVSKRPCEK